MNEKEEDVADIGICIGMAVGETVVLRVDPREYQVKPAYDAQGNIIRLTIVRIGK